MRSILLLFTFCYWFAVAASALPPALDPVVKKSPLSSFIIPPTKIVWTSATGVENAGNLLTRKSGQVVLAEPLPPLILKPGAGIILDFGIQIAGNIELFTPQTKSKEMPSIRLRFGESVAETMAEMGERGAQNDHAIRDQVIQLPWLGKKNRRPRRISFRPH